MLKSFVRNSLSKNFILPFKKGVRFIFIYHDISESGAIQHSKNYSTTPEKFKEQISFLSGLFEWVTLDEITREKPFQKNVACLMFDDGFKSIQTHAMPVLQDHKIPFSVFVCQSAIKNNRLWVSDLLFNKTQLENEVKIRIPSKDPFVWLEKNKDFQNKLNTTETGEFVKEQIYLNAKDIIDFHKQGVTIGNHGSMHVNLSMCNEQNLESEITANKVFIEDLIQAKVHHYAIAFGKKEHYSRNVLDKIYATGHSYVYCSNPGCLNSPVKNKPIPRIGLTDHSTHEIMFYINRQFLKNINL